MGDIDTSQHTGIRADDPSEGDHDPLGYLPEAPVEPLPTDCCGTGCSPCVMDIYQEELQTWLELKAMTHKARAEWRRQRLVSTEKRSVKQALSTIDYQSLVVQSITEVTCDTFLFTFGLPAACCLGFQTGQHYLVRVVDAVGQYVTRPYTPVSPPEQVDSFAILIKLYKEGPMSRCVSQWVVGSSAEWKGPFGGLAYHPNKYKQIGMLACGTGLAPMMQVIRAIVENDDENTFVHLLYSTRNQHTVLMKHQLDMYASYWNFTVHYALSQAQEEEVKRDTGVIRYGDKVHFGRIDCKLVREEMPKATLSFNSLVLICGTKSFDKDMINHLRLCGYTANMYHKF